MIGRRLGALLLVVSFIVAVAGCQNSAAPPAPPVVTPPPPTATPTPEPAPLPENTPVPVPTPTIPVTTPPPPPGEPVPSAPTNVLPGVASLSVDLRSSDSPRVSVVFRFDEKSLPGYYSFSLWSDNDSFGEQRFEHRRSDNPALEVDWAVPAGRPAWYRLRNNESVSEIFHTLVVYSKFVSLTSVPWDTPTDLERNIVDLVNQDRRSRGLTVLTWDDSLYKEALPRLQAFGEEGTILPPPAGQSALETTYVSGSGVVQDASRISGSWIVDPKYFSVISNPDMKSVAVRSDTYSNGRFYLVGLFRTK